MRTSKSSIDTSGLVTFVCQMEAISAFQQPHIDKRAHVALALLWAKTLDVSSQSLLPGPSSMTTSYAFKQSPERHCRHDVKQNAVALGVPWYNCVSG